MRFFAKSFAIACLLAGFAMLKALPVYAVEPLGFSKAFSPAAVDPGEVSRLTYTIDNLSNTINVGSLTFRDSLPFGVSGRRLVSNSCGGSVSAPADGSGRVSSGGFGSLSLSGGAVAAGRTCRISFDVEAFAAGARLFTSGDLTSDLPVATPGASATLTVNAVPLSVSMAFEPATIDQDGISRLRYELRNVAAILATGVSLSNTLPDDVVVADTPNLSSTSTCAGGSVQAPAGGRSITWFSGVLAAGATCTIAVNVTSAVPGRYPNSTESVTSSLGASAAAEATLTVDPPPPPGFVKVFSPDTVDPGGVSTLTFTIDNSASSVARSGFAFTDAFPSGLLVASRPNANNSCGGTLTAAAGTGTMSLSEGAVAAGQACTVSVEVQADRAGALENVSGALTSDLPVTTPGASATLTVRQPPLSVSMAFEPAAIDQGGVSSLSYELRNVAATAATSVSLSDTLPADVVVADPPNAATSCIGGTLSAAAGGGDVSYSGGSLAVGGTCTVSVDVTSTVPGSHPNETESVTSSLGASTPAEATLTVDPAEAPGFARVFAPDSVRQGGETQIVFTVDNTANLIDLGELAFTDAFPDGLVVADAPNAENSCGGTFSPVAGATTLAFADGALAAGATCELRVAVRAIGAGALTGPAVTLTSNVAPATAAEARLDVTPPEAPVFSKAFSPATVAPGEVSRLTFTIDNAANLIDVGGLAFDDDFPDGLAVAATPNGSTTCGGAFAPAASATALAFSGGSVGAGQSCTLSVDVRALRAGALTGTSGELASDLPVTTPGASATLTVSEAALTVVLSFSPSTIGQGGVSTLTYRLRNLAPVAATSVALSDTLPAGVVLADPPNAETTCAGGTLTAAAGGSEVSHSEGTLSRGNACTITVDVTSVAVGSHPNDTVSATSSLGTTVRPTPATLTVDPAAAPGFARVFLPDTIGQGGETQIVFTVDNTANTIAMTGMAFDDSLPPGVSVADTPGAVNGCGGTFSPVAGATTLGFADGVLAAGATCELRVTVRAIEAGTLAGPEVVLTSSIATASAAEAILTVDAAAAPVFAKAFSPATVDPGGVSRLTFMIDNSANAIDVGSLAFTDAFPDGLAVAPEPNADNSCGGTFAPAALATSLAFTGGRVAAGQTCTLAVDVRALVAAGALSGTSGDLTSDLPVATPGIAATLTVNEVPLSVSIAFEPPVIRAGGVSRLTYELGNDTALAAMSVALSDTLPADVVLAPDPNVDNNCGGTLTAAAGGSEVSYSGGTLGADAACMIAVDVTSVAVGTHPNDTESVTSSLGTSAAAEAPLTVDPAEAPGFARVFEPDTIRQGGETEIVFTVDNTANTIGMTGMAFDDSLPPGVSVADPPGAVNGCGGTFSPVAGATTLGFADGVLAAGTTCELRVTVRALEAGTLTYPDVTLTSSIATATAAEAMLTVDPAEVLGFSKSFSPATVDPGGTSRLTFTIDNTANLIDVGGLAFGDDFPDGLAVAATPNGSTTCGGIFAPAVSATSLAFSGGRVAAGQSCTISVDVLASRAGALTGTSGDLTSDLPVATSGASATLTVNAAPLSVSMSFLPPTIDQGRVSRLTYGLDNGAAVAAASVALSDSLPAGVVLADPPDAQTTCAGGTLTAAAGGSEVSYSGGTLGAGATCMIAVDVTSAAAGSHRNDISGQTESVISSLGTSATAEATLTVDAADAPGFARVFSPATIAQGEETQIVFTVDNGANAIAMTEMAFDDSLPPGVSVADTPGAGNDCGGTFNPVAGATTLGFADGVLAAGATCELRVTVRALEAGTLTGPEVVLTSSIAMATAAEAMLTVDPAEVLGFSKSFSPATVDPGGTSRLTFRIDNTANLIDVGGLAFDDDFPDGLSVAGTPNGSTTCGGTFAPATSATSLAFTGGRVAAGQTCTISVDVLASRAGALTGTSGELISDLPVTTPGASAALTVNAAPLSVSMSFLPPTIDQGRVSRLTYGLDNGAAVAAASVSLSDSLPAGVVLADPPDAQTTCTGGTLTAAAGGSEVSYSGGMLGAGATCMIAVDVTSVAVGSHPNDMASATSSLGDSTPAEATLTVDAAAAPGFAKTFSPATVAPGGVSTLTFRIDNAANAIDVGSLAFTDAFPDGLSVAATPNGSTTCGGTFAPATSATSLAFTGGRVAAGQTCTISVDVLASRAGALTSTSGDLTSDLRVAAPGASAALTVNAAPLSVSIAFEPATIDQGRVSRLTYDLNNGAAVAATSVDLSDTLPADVVLADPPDARTTCTGGTLTAGGGDVSYSGGSLGAGAACAITVDVISVAVGSHSNDMASVTSSLGASPPAEATLTVDAAEAPGFSKAFSPARVARGGISRLTYTIDNSANAVAVGGLAFFELFPISLTVFTASNAENSCGGTLELRGDNDELSFTGGSVAAGQTCTLVVDVQGRVVGALESRSDALTSDLPADTPGARAILTVVRSLPLSVSMAFSPPVIRAGGVSRLSYDLRNVTVFEQATSVSLSDTLPPGVVVADPPDAQTTCTGGTLTAAAGSDTITFTGGVFDANAACTISVDMTSTVPGSYRNETESVTSSLGASTPAEATLTVDPAEAPGFARVFAPDSVRQGGETQIVFTVDNTANLIDLGELAFTDAFPDGLVVADAPNAENSCGGTFSPVAGATTLAFADGALAAGATCELRVAVRAIGAGALTGPAVTLTSNVASATTAEARLDVTPPEAPVFSKAFSPATVDPGGVSRLTFTIDNAANLIDVGSLAFDDDFPDGLAVADPPNGSTTCGGIFAPAASATALAFSGGRVGAGQSCTLSVDVRALRAGALTGMSGELASDLPVTTPGASATLTVNEAPLTVSMSFSPSTIGQGGVSTLTYRLRNLAPVPAASVALSDTLPAGVVLADPPNAETTCAGGTLTAAAGGSEVSYSDGTLSRGNACTITVEVTSVAVGSHPNDTVSTTSSLGTTGRPTPATLTVDPAAAPGFARVFSPATIGQGGETEIVFTVDNTANTIAMTGMAFDDSLPPGVSVADTPGAGNSCGGTFNPVAGATTLGFADGVLAAGTTCELRVTVRALEAGTLTGTGRRPDVEHRHGDRRRGHADGRSGGGTGLFQVVLPRHGRSGRDLQADLQIDNTANLIDVGGLAFDDDFPDGLAVAGTPNGSTTCGGTFAPAVSATSLAFTGGASRPGKPARFPLTCWRRGLAR